MDEFTPNDVNNNSENEKPADQAENIQPEEENNSVASSETAVLEEANCEKESQEPGKKIKYYTPMALLLRLIGFILCSLIYIFTISQDNYLTLTTEGIRNASVYFNAIMLFSHIMSIAALIIIVYYLFHLIKPEKFPFEVKTKSTTLAINILDWIMILPICVVISTFCLTFLFTMSTVNGTSMEPTLVQDDELVVLYKRKFERFDIIIIHIEPEHYYWSAEKYFVKRIIGLPGERVDYRYNPSTGFTDLYINNQLVEESFFKEKDSRTVTYQTPRGEEPFEWEERCFYKEDGEKMYCPGSGSSLVIPEGFYFALGDNRVVSEDSRVIGLIYEEDIIGVAKYRRKVLWFERLE